MVLVRRIRHRGANIVVEANGEVLFAPTGDVGRWSNRFSHRVLAATEAAAPTNKRPRWAHYGKPLRATFRASTTYQPGRMKVYSAVGSGSPHAYYVDQGTGIFAGNGPYEAKVLPPYQHGGASLYENTWRPGGPGTRKVKPVFINGQPGQFFFDAGLKGGFASMRMRSFKVPGEGQITKALASIPTGLLGFLGNTVADGAFVSQLEEWRAWRDEAWGRGEGLGRGGGIGSKAHAAFMAKALAAREKKAKAARPKKAQPVIPKKNPKATTKPKVKKPPSHKITPAEAAHLKRMAALRAEERTLISAIHAQFPGARILDLRHGSVNGQPYWFFSISRKGVTTNHKNVSHIK